MGGFRLTFSLVGWGVGLLLLWEKQHSITLGKWHFTLGVTFEPLSIYSPETAEDSLHCYCSIGLKSAELEGNLPITIDTVVCLLIVHLGNPLQYLIGLQCGKVNSPSAAG